MGSPRSFHAFALCSFIVCASARIAFLPQWHARQHHDVLQVEKRQADSSIDATSSAPAATTSLGQVLGYITPSPGATPVAVTEESQIVTSFVPQFTLCDLPPQALISVSDAPSSSPYGNYSVSYGSGTGSCSTVYSPTQTMVCTTTLTALLTKYTITNCAQEITFSTRYGYTLVTPGAASLSLPGGTPSTSAFANLSVSTSPSDSLVPPAPFPSVANLTTSDSVPVQTLSSLAVDTTTGSSLPATTLLSSLPANFTTSDSLPLRSLLPSSLLSSDVAISSPVMSVSTVSTPAISSIAASSAINSAPGLPVSSSAASVAISSAASVAVSPDVTIVGTAVSSAAAPAIVQASAGLIDPDVTTDPVLLRRATVTAGPTIETLTTYYLAPWQQLTAGTAPSNVDLKICRNSGNGTIECVREYEVWSTSLVTEYETTTTSINVSTTVHGPSQIIVETWVANVTEQLTTFSMSTTVEHVYQTQYTHTHSKPRSAAVLLTSTGPTIYSTVTVAHASQSADADPTSTSTLHITSTMVVATSTLTVSDTASTSVAS